MPHGCESGLLPDKPSCGNAVTQLIRIPGTCSDCLSLGWCHGGGAELRDWLEPSFGLSLCVCVCVGGGMVCREAPVWSSLGCEPQSMLGMVSKCWPEHQTLCNLLTLLGQEASNSVSMVSKSGVSISHSLPVLQIINPLGF